MDDLTKQLQSVLADPQALGQLQGLLQSLGGEKEPPAPAAPGLSPQALSLVARLGPVLSQMNQEDDATRLLLALRPLLSPARQGKVDQAIELLRMLRALPVLKESGAFSGLLTGLLGKGAA